MVSRPPFPYDDLKILQEHCGTENWMGMATLIRQQGCSLAKVQIALALKDWASRDRVGFTSNRKSNADEEAQHHRD